MIVHSLSPQSSTIQTATVPDGALTAEQLARLQRHESVFVQSAARWIFGERIMTSIGPVGLDQLELRAGIDPRDGSPGSCDARWIEARLKGSEEIVMRAVDILAHGIEVSARVVAGQVN